MKLLLASLLLRYTKCSVNLKPKGTSLVWTWRGNSWRWVLQKARRYANHSSGRKYYQGTRKVRPQDKDWRTNTKAKSAAIFKEVRDKVAYDPTYKEMRKEWRANE